MSMLGIYTGERISGRLLVSLVFFRKRERERNLFQCVSPRLRDARDSLGDKRRASTGKGKIIAVEIFFL